MADELDRAQEYVDFLDAQHVEAVRRKAALMPKGEPGECEKCGEQSLRLVGGACARCRDRLSYHE